jgi:chemotaxis protein CheX
MPAGTDIQILANELAQIVDSVIGTMIGLGPRDDGPPWYPGENRLTAAVHLSGEWNGAVLLECDHQLACRFAGRFLAIDPPAEVNDIVRDVLGELANMIGGNLKSALNKAIQLSLPSIVDGTCYTVRVCGASVCDRLAFQCSYGPFWVTVFAMPA